VEPIWVHRLRGVVAAVVAGTILYYAHAIDASGRVVNPWTGGVLALVVATFAAAGLAIVLAGYTLVQRDPKRAKIWSNVATGFAVVAIAGFSAGWFYGLAVDA
jgi:hypothetical protein